MQLRLLSYNIHKAIGGVDRRYRPERIIEVVAHYNPDVVCLQEVDEGVKRSQFHQQAEMLADAWGYAHRCYQRNVVVKDGHYGNAIISRWPLSDPVDVDLTIPLKKRRQALVARCHLKHDGHERTLGVVSLHLGLAGFERKRQLRRLLACEVLASFSPRTPLLLAGDYNDVYGELGRAVMLPAGFTRAGGKPRTFPAAAPIRSLDKIFYRGEINAIHSFTGKTKLARMASDHLPLIADFELTGMAE